MRIGTGIDGHRLVPGRKFILGGVELDFPRGPLGHSDGDVLAHSIIDALLGAAALGDIGEHFPDTDPAYEGADSIGLLKKVKKLLDDNGFTVANVDSTIILDEPRLEGAKEAMRRNIAAALDLAVARVSVKATTREGLYAGAQDAVIAESAALLRESGT